MTWKRGFSLSDILVQYLEPETFFALPQLSHHNINSHARAPSQKVFFEGYELFEANSCEKKVKKNAK